jgi:hypothetical protein
MKKIFVLLLLFCLPVVSFAELTQLEKYYGAGSFYDVRSGRIWVKNGAGDYGTLTSKISMPQAAVTAEGAVVKSAAEVSVKNAAGTIAKAGLLSKIGKAAGGGFVAAGAVAGAFVVGEMAIDWLLQNALPADELHKKNPHDGFLYGYQSGGIVNPCINPNCPYLELTVYSNISTASARLQQWAQESCAVDPYGYGERSTDSSYGWCTAAGPNCSFYDTKCRWGGG